LAAVEKYPDIKIPIVDATELFDNLRKNSVIVDIRPREHFSKGHVGGSTNIDLEDLHEQFVTLPRDKKIVLVDHRGKLTLTTARFLASKGYEDVVRLDGGFNAWAKTGLPVEK
jgi:hydroxyacylglutathione hydrolase